MEGTALIAAPWSLGRRLVDLSWTLGWVSVSAIQWSGTLIEEPLSLTMSLWDVVCGPLPSSARRCDKSTSTRKQGRRHGGVGRQRWAFWWRSRPACQPASPIEWQVVHGRYASGAHKSNEVMKIDPRERSCRRAILATKTPIRDAERVLQPGLTTSSCERVGSFSEIFRVVQSSANC